MLYLALSSIICVCLRSRWPVTLVSCVAMGLGLHNRLAWVREHRDRLCSIRFLSDISTRSDDHECTSSNIDGYHSIISKMCRCSNRGQRLHLQCHAHKFRQQQFSRASSFHVQYRLHSLEHLASPLGELQQWRLGSTSRLHRYSVEIRVIIEHHFSLSLSEPCMFVDSTAISAGESGPRVSVTLLRQWWCSCRRLDSVSMRIRH